MVGFYRLYYRHTTITSIRYFLPPGSNKLQFDKILLCSQTKDMFRSESTAGKKNLFHTGTFGIFEYNASQTGLASKHKHALYS